MISLIFSVGVAEDAISEQLLDASADHSDLVSTLEKSIHGETLGAVARRRVLALCGGGGTYN